MNCYTFDYINKLAERFGKQQCHDFDIVVPDELKRIIADVQSCDYDVLLDKMFGIFPEELVKCCKSNGIILNIPHSRQSAENPIRGKKHSELLEILPPPHLANYEWRYTRISASTLLRSLMPMRQNTNTCCLGTPTLALELAQQYNDIKPTLLDINSPLIDEVKKTLFASKIECQVYDVCNELPDRFKNKFDLVFINPPWYLDYYKMFIKRAIELLVKNGGEIILPLFPPLSRHKSLKDLDTLRTILNTIGFDNVSSLGEVSFAMPGFEKKVLQMKNIPIPTSNWRKAEVIKLKLSSNTNMVSRIFEDIQIQEKKWVRSYDAKKKSYSVVDIERLADKSISIQTREFQQLDTLSRKEISSRHFEIWDENNQIVIFR